MGARKQDITMEPFEYEGKRFYVSGWPNGPGVPPVYPWGTRCVTPECRERRGYCSSCPTVAYLKAVAAASRRQAVGTR